MKPLVLALSLSMAAVTPLFGQGGAPQPGSSAKPAKGTFDVKMLPQPADDAAGGSISRLFIDKQFHGDLEGVSKGQMLGSMSSDGASGGYVALELVTGTLTGRRGTFVLQHSGTMVKGESSMTVTVVPNSGTGQLAGLAGQLTIIIDGGKHSYVFEYTLP